MVPQTANGNYSGKIVLAIESLPMEPTWRQLVAHGAIAGITSSPQGVTPGYTQFWTDASNTDDITIYTGELAYDDWIIANNTLWQDGSIDPVTGLPSINVTINGWAPNPWDVLQSPGFLAWQILLLILTAAELLYIVYKLTVIIVYGQRKKIKMAVTICVLEMAGTILRLVYIAVDPLDATRLIPYLWNQVLQTIYFPFGVASNLLFLFCWQEILTMKNMKVSPFLSKLLVPFIVVSIFLFLVDLAGGITRGSNLPQYSIILEVVEVFFYTCILLALAIWTFVIAGRVFKHFRWSKRVFSKKDKLVYNTCVVSTIIGVTYLSLVFLTFFDYVPSLYWDPTGHLLIWFIGIFIFTVRGFLQIFVLNVSKPDKPASVDTTARSSEIIQQRTPLGQEKKSISKDIVEGEASNKETPPQSYNEKQISEKEHSKDVNAIAEPKNGDLGTVGKSEINEQVIVTDEETRNEHNSIQQTTKDDEG
jgi:hypothetical protein